MFSVMREFYIYILTALLVVMVMSCATQYSEESDALNAEQAVVSPPAPAAEELETITVTGSRIAGERDTANLKIRERRIPQRFNTTAAFAGSRKPKIKKEILSWQPSAQSANNAVIKIGDSEKLEADAVDVSIRIDGFRARVVVDGYYTNPHQKNLEGTFKFRLPNGAVPYFFAFGQTVKFQKQQLTKPFHVDASESNFDRMLPADIMARRASSWQQPKVAVMVPKTKAAFAYHSTVARRIDPALLEWSGAGIFSARVFPLIPNQSHRVVMAYDIDLQRHGDDLVLDMPLPLSQIQKRVHLLVNNQHLSSVSLSRVVDGELRAAAKLVNVNGTNNLLEQTVEGTVLEGVRLNLENAVGATLVGDNDVGHFLSRRVQLALNGQASGGSSVAVFAIDTSLSANSSKFHHWVELVSEILKSNEDQIKQFALTSFSIDSHWWKNKLVANNKINRQKLKRYLNTLLLEGATDLASLFDNIAAQNWLRHSANNTNYDLFLLTDGAATWGQRDSSVIASKLRLSGSPRIFTYKLLANGENTELLNLLARESGGASFALSLGREIPSLARAHRKAPWNLISVSANGMTDLLLSGNPKSLYSGQKLTIAGRFIEDNKRIPKSIDIHLERNGESKTISVPTANIIESKLTARIYGQIAVEQLESIGDNQLTEATAFANYFRIPGKSSSLLMLESKADYERYNIKPEADAYTVQSSLVNQLLTKYDQAAIALLANPKQRFLQSVEKLEQMDSVKFHLSDAVTKIMKSLPDSAFRLDANRPHSQQISTHKISKSYLKQLNMDLLSYDKVVKEATRRFKKSSTTKKVNVMDAARAMSSLVEQGPNNIAILRDVAFVVESWGLKSAAWQLHREAAKLRPYEPQSYTYLAKLAHQMGNDDLALLYFEIGLSGQWSRRFGDYNKIHKIDYVNFLRQAINKGDQSFVARRYAKFRMPMIEKELQLLGADLIVAIGWNTDQTDVDLHVVEPSGEECFYQHRKTQSGGQLSQDVTRGFGPEMYVNKTAPSGKYQIYANYYASNQNRLGFRSKVLIRIIKNWGTENEEEQIKTIVLNAQKEKLKVSEVSI